MANRSDFYSAKIPRHVKRMLTLMGAFEPSQRKLWVEAHAAHKRFKMRSNSSPTAGMSNTALAAEEADAAGTEA